MKPKVLQNIIYVNETFRLFSCNRCQFQSNSNQEIQTIHIIDRLNAKTGGWIKCHQKQKVIQFSVLFVNAYSRRIAYTR